MAKLSFVRILGIDYEVAYTDIRREYKREFEVGITDNTLCKITIDTHSLAPAHAGSILLHEIIEALNFRLELELEHAKRSQL